ncbi:histone deacetylase 6 isoform X1 [Achlya hypogyna]|uniref:Histone deacetylase 6 isoform X1 n=1 Tax=Achlya hypogyna TaxID=1202772 RepID=A0A1V9ZTS1_ACHHY|nr:histone deacetylase 6 isoform X1 [Achlya hypogyna]
MAPSSYIPTYSPFLMDSYVSLGINGSVHGFSSPASFFSGVADDQASDEDLYSSLSHLPTSSNTLSRRSSYNDASDEDVGDEDDGNNLGLWNCTVCTKLNQLETCSFCATAKGAAFVPTTQAHDNGRSTLGTAIGFDERMQLHREIQPRDLYDMHPERPDRIGAIYAQCQQDGVVDRCTQISDILVDPADLLRCHSAEYLAYLDEIFTLPFHHLTPDTYCCADTKTAAHLSAGIVVALMEKVVRDEYRNGFAIVRPPGHHAEPQHAMGFCMYNNVAVAAKAAVQKHGLARVLILDWDIHHGNGTEHMFEDDPTVLYCSLHRFDGNGAFYPGTGAPDHVGSGKGAGFNVNVGWPGGGVGDAEYLAAFDRLLMPIFRSFDPQLVLVSAGFDSALGDPLGRCRLSPGGYAAMTHHLCSLANGKVVLALEGGYNLQSIARSASACIRILLGDAVPPLTLEPPMASALVAIETTRRHLAPYWSCLQPVPWDDGSSGSDGDEDTSDEDEAKAPSARAARLAVLEAKVATAATMDPLLRQDIHAKLAEKKHRRRYRPYPKI